MMQIAFMNQSSGVKSSLVIALEINFSSRVLVAWLYGFPPRVFVFVWFFGFLVFVVRCFLAALSVVVVSVAAFAVGRGFYICIFSKLLACGANLVSGLVGFLLVGFLQTLM